jgi:hypothetical protein
VSKQNKEHLDNAEGYWAQSDTPDRRIIIALKVVKWAARGVALGGAISMVHGDLPGGAANLAISSGISKVTNDFTKELEASVDQPLSEVIEPEIQVFTPDEPIKIAS